MFQTFAVFQLTIAELCGFEPDLGNLNAGPTVEDVHVKKSPFCRVKSTVSQGKLQNFLQSF